MCGFSWASLDSTARSVSSGRESEPPDFMAKCLYLPARCVLKPAAGPAEPEGMAREIACPVCDVELLLAGDERRGDSVVCVSCGAPFTVTRLPSKEQDLELEEDF